VILLSGGHCIPDTPIDIYGYTQYVFFRKKNPSYLELKRIGDFGLNALKLNEAVGGVLIN